MDYRIYSIVLVEGLIALSVTSLAWKWRRGRRFVPQVLCGILVGMAWCPFVHGLLFGVLRVEGPQADRDAGALAGFGLVAAVLPGLPLGVLLGLAAGLVSWMSGRRRSIRSPEVVTKASAPEDGRQLSR